MWALQWQFNLTANKIAARGPCTLCLWWVLFIRPVSTWWDGELPVCCGRCCRFRAAHPDSFRFVEHHRWTTKLLWSHEKSKPEWKNCSAIYSWLLAGRSQRTHRDSFAAINKLLIHFFLHTYFYFQRSIWPFLPRLKTLWLLSYIDSAAVGSVACSPRRTASCRRTVLGLMGSPWFFQIKTSMLVAYSTIIT